MSEEGGQPDFAGFELARRLLRVETMGASSIAEYEQLRQAGFELTLDGYWRLELAGGFEVTLEPKIYGGHYLAVYRDQELVHAAKLELQLTPREERGG